MEEQYMFLNEYTDRLIEKGKCCSDIGLWNGKMGIAIYLLHAARITQNEKYNNEAFNLIDAIYEQVSYKMPFCFDNGLLGIACGFEYIISKGFADADNDEMLSEIDLVAQNIIESRPTDTINLKKGICGVGYYLYYRLKHRPDKADDMATLKLKEYLIYWIDWMETTLLNTKDRHNYNDAYFLLCRLQKLNIFNYKVEKLINLCLRKIIDFNCLISDNYELLGINSLKVLKPWM
ncbi:Lanthionine synthetase C-like protein [Saccharicrinis carchari]|uniref:Lanthionine synthetase C-like protein n=1 Tax=Saccharicrinis carchari TaxID=1168039 RepID=A0A521DGY4_SACCC|nr:lanthionine synthetase LanC family protein [Saccharicrinis carchari]SMO70842.1 Lanthionine synthetase C-like protein [Saccharicrinis carchari]